MNYQETIDYLFRRLPMYQRQGKTAFKKNLNNIIALCEFTGNPEQKFPSIHIAGTNGKGSTAHILAAIYRNNGYKVGLYTSPHLVDFRERIRINSKPIEESHVVEFVKEIKPAIEKLNPSFFEITVAMAFNYFASQKVDLAVVETGLGGRLDSTNILIPEISVITSIGYDHMDMLGDSLEKIALEKAGIIKQGVPTVVGLLPQEAEEVIKTVAKNKKSLYHDAIRTPHRFTSEGLVESDLKADYQQLNIKTALAVTNALEYKFETVDEQSLAALKQVRSLSGLRGRWERLQQDPRFLMDVAHNEEGLKINLGRLLSFEKKLCFILGFVQEKDLSKIIPLFPVEAEYYFVRPQIERGMKAEQCAEAFEKYGISGKASTDLQQAIKYSRNALKTHRCELVYIGGSNFIIADLLLLEKEGSLHL